jgi:hypothetical protein
MMIVMMMVVVVKQIQKILPIPFYTNHIFKQRKRNQDIRVHSTYERVRGEKGKSQIFRGDAGWHSFI